MNADNAEYLDALQGRIETTLEDLIGKETNSQLAGLLEDALMFNNAARRAIEAGDPVKAGEYLDRAQDLIREVCLLHRLQRTPGASA